MWIELILVLTLNKYYKLHAIGKYDELFIFIPNHFSVEILLCSAYLIMVK